MEPKVTTMLLKVDLECDCCYKKVKRLCCKYPQIRNQVFDEKNNTVTITVVCCSPEKIRDKLCKKGGKTIKSIQIKETPKPKPPADKPAPKPAPEKPKPAPESEKPKAPPPAPAPTPEKPKQPEPEKPKALPPAPTPEKPKQPEPEKPKAQPPPKPAEPAPAPKPTPAPEPPKHSQCMPTPVQGYPPVYPVPVCCGPCYNGQPGGPCYHQGYYGGGGMVPPPPQPSSFCDPYSYGGGAYRTGYYPPQSRCGDCFSEENPQACSIM